MSNAAVAGKPLYAVHHDHLGTPQKLTNQDQQVVWSADYLPFGEAMVSGGQEVYSRFPGQYYDQESGLYYNYFRDYDPSLGRYIQSDPIGLSGGMNTYAYVGGNPLRFIDPFGLVYVDEKNCGWLDRIQDNCPRYENIEDFVKQWLEKQKDKICGGDTCDKIVQRCAQTVTELTRSTGPTQFCYFYVPIECNKVKKECESGLDGK